MVDILPELKECDASDFTNVWEHHQRLLNVKRGIQTIVTASMLNMVPMDAPHPLYDDAKESNQLRTNFLNDGFLQDRVEPSDARMKSKDGLVVKNFNGNNIVFKKNADGKTSANGVAVRNVETLSDGTVVYTLEEHLFEYRKKVDDAFHELLNRPSLDGRTVCPMERSELDQRTVCPF